MESYTEVSPSGNGIRIIFKAIGLVHDKDKYYINNQKIGLEVYLAGSTSKYVTITGNALNDLDVASRTDEILVVVEKYMRRKPKTKEIPATSQKSYLSDEEVITKVKIVISLTAFIMAISQVIQVIVKQTLLYV